MSNTPTMAEILGDLLDGRREYVALPARVESYDSGKQQVSAQPLIREAYTDENGDRQVDRLPVVNGVPVVFPGSGGFSITWPIKAGDIVLLVFASASMDKWISAGGDVDPLDDRRHTLSDAIAIPGLRPGNAPVSGASSSAMVIQSDGEIQAGGTGALALNADLQGLRAALAALTTGPTAPVGSAATLASGRPNPFIGTSKLRG